MFKGDRLFISMVIDTAENAVCLGHTHNDKLSVEVMIDNQYITRDPGGYIYTAAPGIRDKFRSVHGHNTIQVKGLEQNIFDGTFGMKKRARAELVYCHKDKIIARASYAGAEHLREISISDSEVIVRDYANLPFTVCFKNKIYSTGYGKLSPAKKCQEGKQ